MDQAFKQGAGPDTAPGILRKAAERIVAEGSEDGLLFEVCIKDVDAVPGRQVEQTIFAEDGVPDPLHRRERTERFFLKG